MVRKTHPYKRGYSFERRVRKHLESEGWFVVRQGKSAFPDLICLKDGKIMFVECRVDGYMSPKEKRRLLDFSKKAGADPMTASRAKRKLEITKVEV